MLAEVSALVAILFIVGSVGFVAALILVGLRQRPELEIPPRPMPKVPPPLTPGQVRIHVGLLLVGMGFWVVGLIGAITDARWLVFLGMSVFFVLILARVGFSIYRVVQDRRGRRSASTID
jgi:hypothetical protein